MCKKKKEKGKEIFPFPFSDSKQTREVENEFSHFSFPSHFHESKHAHNEAQSHLVYHHFALYQIGEEKELGSTFSWKLEQMGKV